MADDAADVKMKATPFSDYTEEAFSALDAFELIALAKYHSVLGTICVEKMNTETERFERVKDLRTAVNLDQFTELFGAGEFRCQVNRRGAPGGSLGWRYVIISPEAVPPSANYRSNRAAPENMGAPYSVEPPSSSDREVVELLQKQVQASMAQLDEMRKSNDRLRDELREQESQRERDRVDADRKALKNELDQLRDQMREMKDRPTQSVDRSREDRLEEKNERLFEKLLDLKSGDSKSKPDGRMTTTELRGLKEELVDLFPNRDSGWIDRLFDGVEKLAEVALPHMINRKSESDAPQVVQQIQAPAEQLEYEDDEVIQLADVVFAFLATVADERSNGARASLKEGIRAVAQSSGPEGVDILIGELAPWTERDFADPNALDQLRDYLLSCCPLAVRMLVAPKLKNPEVRKHVLGVLRELKAILAGLNAGDEQVIKELQGAMVV